MDAIKRAIAAIIMVALAWFSFQVSETGYHKIEQLRQLERLPHISIASVLTGESHIQGWARADTPLLKSPRTQTPSIYYAYLKEKRCKKGDSEGWCTVESRSKYIPFYVVDHSSEIDIKPSGSVDWQVARSYQSTEGSLRYTEWRIEPEDKITLFGWASKSNGKYTISFSQAGQYTPIIATDSDAEIRTTAGSVALAFIWGGIALLALSGLALVYTLKIHRVLVFVVLLTLVLSVLLFSNGINMLRKDLNNSEQRAEQIQRHAEQEVKTGLENIGIQWSGWQEKEKLAGILTQVENTEQEYIKYKLQNLVSALYQIQQQQSVFPANVFYLLKPSRISEHLTALLAATGLKQQDMPPLAQTRIDHLWGWLFCLATFVITLLAGFFGVRSVRFKRFLENIPTSKIAGMSMGLTEIKGKILKPLDGEALVAPLSQQDCIWYHYTVKERRRSGKNTKWVTITDEQQSQNFLLEDDTGTAPIRVNKADISTQHSKNRRRGNRKHSVEWLEINDKCYVIGECQVSKLRGHELEISETESDQPFIISNYSEQQLLVKKAFWGMMILTLAFCCSVATGLFLFASVGGFAISDFFAAALVPATMMLSIILVIHYNDLIFLKQRVQRNRANIDVALQKRFDTLNNLIPVVKKLLSHEKEVLKLTVQLRTQNQQSQQDNQKIAQYLAQEHQLQQRFSLLKEQYPELKSNTTIKQFMKSLNRLETGLAYAKSAYNDAVEIYNSRIHSFPDLIMAKILKLNPEAWLKF